MEEEKIEGTYTALPEDDWRGNPYECNECGAIFMTFYDEEKCYCPGCGKLLIWKDVVKGVE